MSEAAEASIHSVVHSSSSQPEKVEANAYGAPISDNAGKIDSRTGNLVRIHVPISYESWKKPPKKCKDDVWTELRESENPENEITSRQVWEKTHTKKDGTISDSNSSYFGKIAKAKETINGDKGKDMPLDEDILSQMFDKDRRGRTRSVGTMISKSQVKASTIPRKQLKRSKGDSDNLKARMEKLEGTLENVERTLKSLVGMLKRYVNREKQILDIASNEGGSSGTHQESVRRTLNNDDVANPLISYVSTNKKCEVLNLDLEVVATGFVCRDSTASIIHEKPVPPTHEKLVVDSILLPYETTAKQNHPLAMTFDDVGIGGYVCHPKSLIRYL